MASLDGWADGYEVPNEQIAADIDRWINGRNAERNRAILKRRMIDGITFEALALEFDLSYSQVCRIVYKTSAILFRHVAY